MYDIPKEIKAKPKIVGLEVKELIILLVSFFLFFTVLKDLVHGILFIPYILIAGGTLFWMVLPSRNNPQLKNYMSLYLYFKRNKYTYHAVDVKKIMNDFLYGEGIIVNKEKVKPIIVPTYMEEKASKKSFLKKFPYFQKNKTTRKKVERKSHVLRKIPMIMPFLDITEEYIVMKKGYFMDIFQISPNDLHSLTDTDITIKLLEKARFYRSSASQHKVVGLNFPANTEKQRLYWERKKERTTDPLRILFINRKLFELEFIARERTNREFFLFVYAESSQTLEDEKKQVVRGMKQSFPLQTLSNEKKQDILFMMSNQNSKL